MTQDTILIVDDMSMNRVILRDLFVDVYRILEAENGREAIDIIAAEKERMAIVLLDIVMPVMDGFGVMQYMKDNGFLKYIPVIMITGNTSDESAERGFDLGVTDYIAKPFNTNIVRKRVFNVVDLYHHKNQLEFFVKIQTEKLERQSKKLRETNNLIIDTLGTVVEFRNLESGQHIKRIKAFTKVLLECVAENYTEYHVSKEEIDSITAASALHDVGKIVVPDEILLKPSRLDAYEFEIMKTHTLKGCELINTMSFLEDKKFFNYCYDICRHHHEKYDGKGYPDGLMGEDIPIAAQVVSLADVYEALTSKRVYKEALDKNLAFQMILNGECGAFSPKMQNCLNIVKEKFEDLSVKLV